MRQTIHEFQNFFKKGDIVLLTLCLILSAFGCLVIASATNYIESFRYVILQIVGALIGILQGWTDRQIMEFASGCAVMALGSPDATSGMKTEEEIKNYCKQFARREVAK